MIENTVVKFISLRATVVQKWLPSKPLRPAAGSRGMESIELTRVLKKFWSIFDLKRTKTRILFEMRATKALVAWGSIRTHNLTSLSN